ncbi:MAG: glycoside hydrolase family 127 protein [Clostridium sp.]|nr:glycoside hydrolase family 127 protein [Clostridium sp.]
MNKLILSIAACLALPMSALAQSQLYPNTFDLTDVEITAGPFKHACELNVSTLLQYDTDRLMAPYLKTAGLQPKGESFENWIGLDGHVGGHYLSACAIHYAATGNEELKRRADYMVDEIARAQEAGGDGYVGGVERKCWQRVANGDVAAVWDYWVPWYNLHKTFAGLRDAWLYAGNDKARASFLALCDWCVDLVAPLSDKQMEDMLNCEFGGMDEVLADAYQMTGDNKYLDCAKKFSHHWLLDSMAAATDNLDNKHANTQVPKVVGYQRIAELSTDAADAELYDLASRNFWNFVVNDRSLALGGNSRREHFASAADCLSYVEEREGPESCNTNNMLKLTEGLFRMHGDARYVDFYERAMLNHILSTQHPEHGGYVYFTSARPGHYRVYSTPNSAMWCCVGTGMENHGKYGQFIYSHQGDTLDVNLFLPSKLNWREKGVQIEQVTEFPASEASKIIVHADKPKTFTLKVRVPGWTPAGQTGIAVNGKRFNHSAEPSSWASITREWKDGDVVDLQFPFGIALEPLPNAPQYVAIMRGPVLMAANVGADSLDGLLSDDGRWAHIAHGPLKSLFSTPFIIGEKDEALAKLQAMKPVEGKELTYVVDGLFTIPDLDADGASRPVVLQPFYSLHDCRYAMYWPMMNSGEYTSFREKARAKEAEALRLDKITVDAITLSEQQPEVDHSLKHRDTSIGNSEGEPWRSSNSRGFMTFTFDTKGRQDLALMLRLHDADDRDFEILVGDTPICSQAREEGKEGFANHTYAIPAELLQGKETIDITLRGATGRLSKARVITPEN